MSNAFLAIAATPAVKATQDVQGSRHAYARLEGGAVTNDHLGPAEAAFIAARDSFYMATVSETGWPYLQHRGGPPGFLHVLDGRTLALADLRGNRQYISLGNLANNDRAALILVDYPNRRRLKLYARVAVREAADALDLLETLSVHRTAVTVERVFLLHVEAFDWNCPQHITPRFTAPEVAAAVSPLHERLAALEAENAALRARLATHSAGNSEP
jgi:hypothetical protein